MHPSSYTTLSHYSYKVLFSNTCSTKCFITPHKMQANIVTEIHLTLPHDHVQYLKYIATLASCPTFPIRMLWQKTMNILILSENFGTKSRQSPTKRQSHMYINLHDMTDLIYRCFWRIRLKILLIAREF